MTADTEYVRANIPAIAAEEIDGEIVIVSFDSGHYFSLRDTAADIWRHIEAGIPVERIIAAVASNGEQSATRAFIESLRTEGLVVAGRPSELKSLPVPEPGRFKEPTLERFEEMSDMLLYDPIHDVDQTGWPNLPNGG